MSSSEYLRIDKTNYVRRIVGLEAEIIALRKKIQLYDNALKTQMTSRSDPTEMSILNFGEDDKIRECIKVFLNGEDNANRDMLTYIIEYMMTPKRRYSITIDTLKKYVAT